MQNSMEDKLQSFLILLKNSPDLSSDSLPQLFQKAFDENATTEDLLQGFISLEKNTTANN